MTNEEKWERGRRFMVANDAGKTYREIAAEEGLKPLDVHHAIMIVRPKTRDKKWLDRDLAELISMRAAGKTVAEISDAIGVPLGSLATKIAELQLPTINARMKRPKCPPLTG